MISKKVRTTLEMFLKAHRKGKKHMRTVKADTAYIYGLAEGLEIDPHGHKTYRLEIGDREIQILLKICTKEKVKIKKKEKQNAK